MRVEVAEKRMRDLMRKHLCPCWRFEWCFAMSYHGMCYIDRRIIRISEGYVQVSPWKKVRKLIMHEIAHALVPIKEPEHGPLWKQIIISLGEKPDVTLD